MLVMHYLSVSYMCINMLDILASIITDKHVSFTEIAGCEEAKQSLKEMIRLLYEPREPMIILQQPLAVLLYGVRRSSFRSRLSNICFSYPLQLPGNGKTYLAKAMAAECNATFIAFSSCEFISRWRDNSEKEIKYLFELARARQPSIVFLDDIEVLYTEYHEGESTECRVLNDLIKEMDGQDFLLSVMGCIRFG